MTYLGVDLGTSALKAVLVDDEQAVLAEAAVPLRTFSPHHGWSEQHPADWWSALLQAVAHLRAARPAEFRAVRALGLSGQMHAAVLVDRAGAVIRPAILWNDWRATRECAALQSAVPDLGEIAGVVAMPGLTAPKLLWLKANEPTAFARIFTVLGAKDYLRLRLSGDAITDMSDAAGTLWLDEGARDWSDAVLAATGLSRTEMSRLAEGSDAAGQMLASIREEWGIDGPVILAGGAGDAASAAIGIGAVQNGDAFVSLGTSAQYFLTDDRYRPQPESLLHAFAHALPGRWFRMAAMLNGASSLEWVARIVGGSGSDIPLLLDGVEANFWGPSRLLFLPYLAGERTPHNDPAARGVFFGLDAATEPADLVQATLDGVAFSLLEAQELLEAAGVRLDAVAAVGGGARSRFWMQIVAHALGRPVIRYAGSDKGPAFGAARLARLALTGEAAIEVCSKPPVLDVLEPDAALHAAYAAHFQAFKRLYRALKGEFAAAVRDSP